MVVGLGVDFEHLRHTPAYRGTDGTEEIDFDLREVTERLLRLFEKHDASATFFVVAELTEGYLELIAEIADHGHEIASHTVTHPSLPSLETETKRREIRRSKHLLEDHLDITVQGFRAPTFQVDDEVYDLLVETGYSYSSSTIDTRWIPGFYSTDYPFSQTTGIRTFSGELIEQPVSVSPYLRLPITGAWLRLLGRQYAFYCTRWLLSRGKPVVTYVHPWEFVNLESTTLPLWTRFRTGEWLFETYQQLLALDAKFYPVRTVVTANRPQRTYSTSNAG